MKKLFLRAEFGPLWEPWEVDEIGRNIYCVSTDPKDKMLLQKCFDPIVPERRMVYTSP